MQKRQCVNLHSFRLFNLHTPVGSGRISLYLLRIGVDTFSICLILYSATILCRKIEICASKFYIVSKENLIHRKRSFKIRELKISIKNNTVL